MDGAVDLTQDDDEVPAEAAVDDKEQTTAANTRGKRQSGYVKRARTSLGAHAEVQLAGEDGAAGVSVKRSMRIQALEGQKQKEDAERQERILHSRIAALLKKVEYMDRKNTATEEKLADAKRQAKENLKGARSAKTSNTSDNVQHLTEISAKDKEIAKLNKALRVLEGKGAASVSKQPSPRQTELEARVTKAEKKTADLQKSTAAKDKKLAALETKLRQATEKSQREAAATKEMRTANRALEKEVASLKAKQQEAQAAPASAAASDPQVEKLRKQVKELEKTLATTTEAKKKAEQKRDVSEQRRCDALLEQGRTATSLEELTTAVKSLAKGGSGAVVASKHKLLQPIVAAFQQGGGGAASAELEMALSGEKNRVATLEVELETAKNNYQTALQVKATSADSAAASAARESMLDQKLSAATEEMAKLTQQRKAAEEAAQRAAADWAQAAAEQKKQAATAEKLAGEVAKAKAAAEAAEARAASAASNGQVELASMKAQLETRSQQEAGQAQAASEATAGLETALNTATQRVATLEGQVQSTQDALLQEKTAAASAQAAAQAAAAREAMLEQKLLTADEAKVQATMALNALQSRLANAGKEKAAVLAEAKQTEAALAKAQREVNEQDAAVRASRQVAVAKQEAAAAASASSLAEVQQQLSETKDALATARVRALPTISVFSASSLPLPAHSSPSPPHPLCGWLWWMFCWRLAGSAHFLH